MIKMIINTNRLTQRKTLSFYTCRYCVCDDDINRFASSHYNKWGFSCHSMSDVKTLPRRPWDRLHAPNEESQGRTATIIFCFFCFVMPVLVDDMQSTESGKTNLSYKFTLDLVHEVDWIWLWIEKCCISCQTWTDMAMLF